MTSFLDRLRRWLQPARRQPAARLLARLEALEDRTTPVCLSPDAFICAPLAPTHEGLAMHIHPKVSIFINGVKQTIPANVGINLDASNKPTGYLPIHTHDAAGMLHVEAPVVRTFTLKDFFDTWGFVFGNQEVAGYITDTGNPLQMTVAGQPNTQFGALVLSDQQEIVIRATNAIPLANLGIVANGLSKSDESYSYFITQAYQRYLGRTPEKAGRDGWIARMRAGLTDEQLEANFIGSAEYIANHGGTGAAWVQGLYQDLLGRPPDNAGLQGWLNRLNSGMKPYDIAYGFAASAEREAIRIRADYVTLLGREPSQEEVNAWTNVFLSGVSNETVVAGFVGSREYYNNTNKGKGDRVTWVRTAYQDLLHRTPTDAEVAGWVAVLNR